MKKIFACTFALFAGAILSADGLYRNPLADAFKSGIIDAKNSSETPAQFNEQDRKVRWNNVLRTNQPCPHYESWRTKAVGTPQTVHSLNLVFSKPYTVGTLFAFGTDEKDTSFRMVSPALEKSGGTSAVTATFKGAVSSVRMDAVKIEPSVVTNWGYRKDAPEAIVSYQFGILALYALPEKRENIAPLGTASVSGTLLNRKEEQQRLFPAGLNDEKTCTFWRSEKLQPDGKAEAVLTFPTPVTVREVVLYFGNNTYNQMPSLAEVSADDAAFGTFDAFSNHPHQGSHFYLIQNKNPEKKITSLRFKMKPRDKNNVVGVTEILVLAKPGENSAAEKAVSAAKPFNRAFHFDGKDVEYVSARVEDASGKVVRNLTPAERTAGQPLELLWDGTDTDGRAVVPGEYTLRGITRKTLRAEYESTPYSPVPTPWVTPSRKGGWLSDHVPPSTIEPMQGKIWVGAPFAESGDCIMQLDEKGQKLWGVRWLNLAGASVMRPFADKIYVASGGGWVGQKAIVTELDPVTKKFKENVVRFDFPAPYNQKKNFRDRILSGFTVSDKYFIFSLFPLNKVVLYGRDGKQIREISVDKPGAIRTDKDGAFLIVSNDTLRKLNPEKGTLSKPIVSGLKDARDFIILPEGGYLIADAGANQVIRFDRKGKKVRAYGTGKPHEAGAYNQDDIQAPTSVAMLNGKLWIAEGGRQPARILTVDAASGKVEKEWLGPARYEAGSWFDPENVNVFYFEGMKFVRKDDASPWTLDSVYYIPDPAKNPLLEKTMMPERPFRLHGKLFIGSDRHWSKPAVWIGELGENKILRPHAAVGIKDKTTMFLWNDLNRNGLMEESEIQTSPHVYNSMQWNSRIGRDLSFYFQRDGVDICKITPEWKDGLPVYNLEQLKVIYHMPVKKTVFALSPVRNGLVFMNLADGLTGFDEKSGKVLWRYPNPYPTNSHDSPLPKPGEVQHTLNLEGSVELPNNAGTVFMLNSNKGFRHLFMENGVYAGQLFADQRLAAPLSFDNPKRGQDLSRYSLMDEAFCGTFERCADGLVRFSGGKNHNAVSIIRNLETIRPFTQSFTLTQEEAEQAAKSVAEKRRKAHESAIREKLTIKQIASVPTFRGNEADWKDVPAVCCSEDGREFFTVRLAKTTDALTGVFVVKDDSPFINGGGDSKLLFKTGDSVNLEFGNHQSAKIEPGDVRILIAPYQGNPAVVIYRYKTASPAGTKPVEFTSPVGNVAVEKLEICQNAVVNVRASGNSYVLEFEIPLAEVPALGKTPLYGDAGVIFSDPSGQVNSFNRFYNGTSKGVTADVPSEIRLSPKEWGEIQVR